MNNSPFAENSKTLSYLDMDGQEVYKFAVSMVPASILHVLDQAGAEVSDIKYYVLHQANIRIIQSVASVPILLDEINRKGILKAGDKIVVSGFGAGLTWASAVVEW